MDALSKHNSLVRAAQARSASLSRPEGGKVRDAAGTATHCRKKTLSFLAMCMLHPSRGEAVGISYNFYLRIRNLLSFQ